jgi:hypothetical protein
MSARLFDNPFRWLISSKSRIGEHHMVDLSAHAGHGECSCEDFQITRMKRIKAMEPRSMRTRCKHIQEAREAFAVWLIDVSQGKRVPDSTQSLVTRVLNLAHHEYSSAKRPDKTLTP